MVRTDVVSLYFIFSERRDILIIKNYKNYVRFIGLVFRWSSRELTYDCDDRKLAVTATSRGILSRVNSAPLSSPKSQR